LLSLHSVPEDNEQRFRLRLLIGSLAPKAATELFQNSGFNRAKPTRATFAADTLYLQTAADRHRLTP